MSKKRVIRALVDEIAVVIDESRLSRRRVEERAGFSRGYLSRLLNRRRDLKVWHFLAVLRVLECHPGEFFVRLGPADAAEPGPGPLEPTVSGITPGDLLGLVEEARRRDREVEPIKERLQHLGVRSLASLRSRLERCELLIAALRRPEQDRSSAGSTAESSEKLN